MSPRTAAPLRVRLKPADPFDLIRLLARSQNDPRKALAELVQNSLDAGAGEVTIIRRSSVDMVLGLQYRHVSVPRYVGLSPPSLPWVPAVPVPHFHRYYEGRTTAPVPSRAPSSRRSVPLPRDASSLHGSVHLHRFRGLARLGREVPFPNGGRKETRSSPRFLANPFAAPRDLALSVAQMLPSAGSTASASATK